MKRIKFAAVLLCLACILLLSSPIKTSPSASSEPNEALSDADPYETSILEAAAICNTVYALYPKGSSLNVVLSDEAMGAMLDALSENGFTAIDGENAFDMRNPAPVMKFGDDLNRGTATEVAYFTVYSDGHIGMSILTPTHIRTLSAEFTDIPTIYLRTESELTSIAYTDKGWLIYSRDPANVTNAKQFNVDPYTMVRIKPLSQELRELCRTYITPVGYSENNFFLTSWDAANMDAIDYASLYAMFYGMTHDGETLSWYSAKAHYEPIAGSELFLVPAEEFESVMQTYLPVDRSTLRTIPEYSSSRKGYYFLGWQTGYYSVVPRLPTPEVVNAVYNTDGSITMEVDALYSWYGTDKAFTHFVTVQPDSNGRFQYLSNTIEASDSNIFPDRLLPNLRAAAIKQVQ